MEHYRYAGPQLTSPSLEVCHVHQLCPLLGCRQLDTGLPWPTTHRMPPEVQTFALRHPNCQTYQSTEHLIMACGSRHQGRPPQQWQWPRRRWRQLHQGRSPQQWRWLRRWWRQRHQGRSPQLWKCGKATLWCDAGAPYTRLGGGCVVNKVGGPEIGGPGQAA